MILPAYFVLQMILPSYVGTVAQAFPAANTLYCARVVAYRSDSFTKFGGRIDVGAASGHSGFALYPDDDNGNSIAAADAATTSATSVVATGLNYSVVLGTKYRICACGTSTSIQYLAMRQSGTGTGQIATVLNAVAAHIGTGGNSCSAGVPPATTGAITGATNFRIPEVTLE